MKYPGIALLISTIFGLPPMSLGAQQRSREFPRIQTLQSGTRVDVVARVDLDGGPVVEIRILSGADLVSNTELD